MKAIKIYFLLVISCMLLYLTLYFIVPIGIIDALDLSPNINNIGGAFSRNTFQNNSVVASRKIVYLTFDDGPSIGVTNKILDILKKYNVKATFFVVGNKIENNKKLVKRIYREGHSIGLHSYSHNYKYIYADQNRFINEMNRTADEVYKVIGVKSKIIRFPGGTYQQLNKEFLQNLHVQGYKLYDWNVDCGDGIYANYSPKEIYKNAITTGAFSNRIILLAHCTSVNLTTVKALPKIITYYKKLGYEFKPITSTTPEFYFDFTD